MIREPNIRKVVLFISLTFLLSWSIAATYFFSGREWNTTNALITATIYMFIPMISAIIVQKFIYKERLRNPLGISFKINRWFFAAWLFPIILSICTLGISLLFPGVELAPDMSGMFERFEASLSPEQIEQMKAQISPIYIFWLTLFQGLIAGITINAVAGFGEELGWRGFLQKELSFLGFWKASMFIGLIWGIWHAPLILQGHNYPNFPVAGVGMMTLAAIFLGPIFSYFSVKAKSVIAAAIMHGTFNGTYGLSILLIKGGNDLLVGSLGLAGVIVLITVNLLIFVYEHTLAKQPVERIYQEYMP